MDKIFSNSKLDEDLQRIFGIGKVEIIDETKPKKQETYFRKEMYDENGNRYYETKEKANNGFYKITMRYSKDNITTEYIK